MVIPLAFSSGALSMSSYFINLTVSSVIESVLLIAAVRVVLPWSTCPIVPTFTWGLVLSNLAFANLSSSLYFGKIALHNYSHFVENLQVKV